jgi:hypothetical protein
MTGPLTAVRLTAATTARMAEPLQAASPPLAAPAAAAARLTAATTTVALTPPTTAATTARMAEPLQAASPPLAAPAPAHDVIKCIGLAESVCLLIYRTLGR